MSDFNIELFIKKLYKNKNVKNITQTSNAAICITFQDDFKLYIKIHNDGYHPFSTFVDNFKCTEYFYVGEMHQDNYPDLYGEINRMSKKNTRSKLPKYAEFKMF